MTTAARPSFEASIAAAHDLQEVQRWRAAQTVRAHVSSGQGQDDVLDCLGLTDVERPVNA